MLQSCHCYLLLFRGILCIIIDVIAVAFAAHTPATTDFLILCYLNLYSIVNMCWP